MPKSLMLGEFEHLALLAIARLGAAAHASAIRVEIAAATDRPGTRGALYRTLDRLETKGFLSWKLEEGVPRRGGNPRRCFAVTTEGVAALKACRVVFTTMWTGLDHLFDESSK